MWIDISSMISLGSARFVMVSPISIFATNCGCKPDFGQAAVAEAQFRGH